MYILDYRSLIIVPPSELVQTSLKIIGIISCCPTSSSSNRLFLLERGERKRSEGEGESLEKREGEVVREGGREDIGREEVREK